MPLLKAFSAEKIVLQHKIFENERIRNDMYFFEHTFLVEIDKKGHIHRNQNKENERQKKQKNILTAHSSTGLTLT